MSRAQGATWRSVPSAAPERLERYPTKTARARAADNTYSGPHPDHRGSAAALLALVILAASWLVHWRTFNLAELGVDGYLSVDLGNSPLKEMAAFTARDVHPPLFYALLHLGFATAGLSYVTAKFVPIASSMVALVAVYGTAKMVVGRPAGLVAMGLLAVSAPYLYLSPTVRPFSTGLALSMVTLLQVTILVRARRRQATSVVVPTSLALLVCTTAALLTWYLHVAFFGVELIALWLAWRPSPASMRYRRLTLGYGALAVGFLAAMPWYAYASAALLSTLSQGGAENDQHPTAPSLQAVATTLTKALVGRNDRALDAVAAVGLLIALAVGVAILPRSIKIAQSADAHEVDGLTHDRWGIARVYVWVVLGGLLVGLAEMLVILSRWQHPDAAGRYLLAVVPFVAMLQAVAIVRAPMALQALTIAGVTIAAFCQVTWVWGLMVGTGIDWRHEPDLVYVMAHSRPGDAIVFSDRARRMQYRLAGGTLPASVVQTSGDAYLHDSRVQALGTINSVIPTAGRVWYLETGEHAGTPPLGRLELDRQAFPTWHQTIQWDNVQLFLTEPADRRVTPNVTLSNSVVLTAAAFTSHARPGGAVAVALSWRVDRPIGSGYSVFVHLDDERGQLGAQHDGPPGGEMHPTDKWKAGDVIEDRHGVTLPLDMAPGAYRLNVGLYKGDQRLAMTDGTNAIDLGVVTISAS